jgi:hypothetical protein
MTTTVSTGGGGRRAAVLWGALWAVVLAFPFAAVCGLVYRFPIPFGGYASGPTAMLRALGAVVFYGLLGGFPALLVLGWLGGAAAYSLGRPELRRVHRLTLGFAALIALLGVVLLAILDKVIGPW